jgi:hypothetical protein
MTHSVGELIRNLRYATALPNSLFMLGFRVGIIGRILLLAELEIHRNFKFLISVTGRYCAIRRIA